MLKFWMRKSKPSPNDPEITSRMPPSLWNEAKEIYGQLKYRYDRSLKFHVLLRDPKLPHSEWFIYHGDTNGIDFKSAFSKFKHPKEQLVLNCLATLSWDGYIRQEGLERLSASFDPVATPFILVRLGDWVYPIRKLTQALIAKMHPQFPSDFLRINLSLLRYLEQRNRSPELGLLWGCAFRDGFTPEYRQLPEFERKKVVASLIQMNQLKPEHLDEVLSDPRPGIRFQVAKNYYKLNFNEAQTRKLQSDSSSNIRRYLKWHKIG